MKLVLTCEHGGNAIPQKHKHLFHDHSVLQSHRGFDLGALDTFNHLKPLADASKKSKTSRLLIELNRSLHHENLFSEYTKALSATDKSLLISDYYLVYRNEVESAIKKFIEGKKIVLHVSVHSFTPKLNGKERHCDIGLLYDPKKPKEKEFCKQIKDKLVQTDNNLSVRFNYPYLGKADGFTTYLRKQFPNHYIGIELEINQKHSKNNQMDPQLKADIFNALLITLQEN
ncbi:MAG: N-formylglutamate amidohydrolase [Xanthomarina gelatinilytica]|uniref:N-formylglutamate amidohydrolase n=1 Tax=Xanthomarina gelatinilytica TaxID=1137281 RepID=UPI003A88068F